MNGKYKDSLDDCDEELIRIKTWIDSNKLDSNVRFLVNYVVIKSCGTIEFVYKNLMFDYLSAGANIEAVKYFENNVLNSSSNPSLGKIKRMLQQFNGAWAEMFFQLNKGSQLETDLNSLVNLRNTFAHGGTLSASIDEVVLLYCSSKQILDQIYSLLFNT